MNTMNYPDKTGNNRGPKGKFTQGQSGNPKGRPKGSVSITEGIKRILLETPVNCKKTNLDQMVELIVKRAIDGDVQMMKAIWSYIDGSPRGSIDMGIDRENLKTLTGYFRAMASSKQ